MTKSCSASVLESSSRDGEDGPTLSRHPSGIELDDTGRNAAIAAAFQKHDVNGSGQLDYKELQKVLADIGMASDSHEVCPT